MSIITRYNFDKTKVSNIFIDTTFPYYIWIAFEKNDDDVCLLEKRSASNLNDLFYSTEVDCDKIVKIDSNNSYINLAIEHDDYLGLRYNKVSPLSVVTYINKPVGVNENPIDLLLTATNTYFLIPGDAVGENCKIIKFNTSGTYQETIDLPLVKYARSITIDSLNNFWIVTYTNPANIVRVWYDVTWQSTITSIGA